MKKPLTQPIRARGKFLGSGLTITIVKWSHFFALPMRSIFVSVGIIVALALAALWPEHQPEARGNRAASKL
jgi:hypothetical protein